MKRLTKAQEAKECRRLINLYQARIESDAHMILVLNVKLNTLTKSRLAKKLGGK